MSIFDDDEYQDYRHGRRRYSPTTTQNVCGLRSILNMVSPPMGAANKVNKLIDWEREGHIQVTATTDYSPTRIEPDRYIEIRFGKQAYREPLDIFPSDHLMANVALAVQAGVATPPGTIGELAAYKQLWATLRAMGEEPLDYMVPSHAQLPRHGGRR